jgi:hypothetical protein
MRRPLGRSSGLSSYHVGPAVSGALDHAGRLRRHPSMPLVAALLIILGLKTLLIGVAGNPTPFWDQWDAEGWLLIRPWLDGSLRFADLMAAHNEHRIVLSRLLLLAILEIAGNWNTLLEMAINAVIHVIAIALLFFQLRRVDIGGRQMLLAVFAVLLLGLPLDAENVLWGFQSQFYFLLLLSTASLCLIASARALSARWLVAALIATASFLALASGALTLLAAGGFCLVQMVVGSRQRSLREAVGIALLLGGSVVLIALTPSVARHQVLQAHGVLPFIMALARTAGWPFKLSLLGPVLLNLPTGLLLWRAVRQRWSLDDPRWRIIGLVLWTGLQAASIAYGRAGAPVASRYIDIFALLPLLNLFALLHLWAPPRAADGSAGAGPAESGSAAPQAWLVLVVGFTAWGGVWLLPGQPGLNASYTRAQVANVRAYVATGDRTTLHMPRSLPSWRPVGVGDPDFSIPYPDPDKLGMILDRPEVRGVLPAPFAPPAADRALARQRLRLGGGLDIQPARIATLCRAAGGLLLGVGLALLLLTVTALPVPVARAQP